MIWSLIVSAIVGLAAGALAKAVLPGDSREPKGCLMTMLLGMAGGLLFGIIAGLFLGWDVGGNLVGRIASATIGAVLIILLLRRFAR